MTDLTICIENGCVWNGEAFQQDDIAIAFGKIAGIGDIESFSAYYHYDARGKWVLPGLVDIHTHLRGLSEDELGIPAEACLPFGVTAAVDCGAVQGDVRFLDACPLRTAVFVAGRISDNHLDLRHVEEQLKRYGSYALGVKIYMDQKTSPVRTIMLLREAAAFAKMQNLKLMVHCSNSPVSMGDILAELQSGDILTHIFHGGNHSALEEDLCILKDAQKKGIILDAALAGHVHCDFGVMRSMLSAGIFPDTISTDLTRFSAYTRGGFYGLPMCMNILATCGMPGKAIIRSVTSAAANAAGKPEWSRVEIGARADLAVFDETGAAFFLEDAAGNRVSVERSLRCRLTILDGNIVYRC